MGFRVEGMYYEPGMAFAGIWEDGNDEYYELGGMNSTQVASDIPSQLDECFMISESMREWEEDNEEELTHWIRDGKEKLGLVAE